MRFVLVEVTKLQQLEIVLSSYAVASGLGLPPNPYAYGNRFSYFRNFTYIIGNPAGKCR